MTKYLVLVAPYFLVAGHSMAHAEIEIVASYAVSPDWQFKPLQSGGRFKNRDGASFIDVTKTELGHNVDLSLTKADAQSPRFQAAVFATGDKWLDLDFASGGGEGGFFNPYGLPFNVDWTHGRHILPPSESPYVLGKSLIDRECTFNFAPCSETNGGFIAYEAREIDPPLPGDANLDGTVAFDDFLELSSFYGNGSEDIFLRPAPGWFRGDFDLDGIPDMDDFLVLSANYGKTIDATKVLSVPEPSQAFKLVACLSFLGLQSQRLRRVPLRRRASPPLRC